MIWKRWGVLLLAVGASEIAATEPRPSDGIWWVDAASRVPGAGTRDSPLRSLEDALARSIGGDRIQLGAGEYRGAFRVPEGVTVIGTRRSVLIGASEDQPTLTLGNGAGAEKITLRSGSDNLVALGDAHLKDLWMIGAARSAVRVERGTLRGEGLSIQGGNPRAIGIDLGGQARAILERSVVRGPMRRGVQLTAGAQLELVNGQITAVEVGIHGIQASVTLEHVSLEGGKGPALFMAGGMMRLKHVRVQGHEYALLGRSNVTIGVEDFVSARAARAGVAVVESALEARELRVIDSGNLGGVQSVGARLKLDHFEVLRPTAYGVSLVGGTAVLRDGRVLSVRADAGGGSGEALHVSRARAEVHGLTVRSAEGSCVVVLEHGELIVRDGVFEACQRATFDVAGWSTVDARAIELRGGRGPAAVISEGSELTVDGWSWGGGGSRSIAADCAEGVHVWAGTLHAPGALGFDAPCVRPLKEKPARRQPTPR